MYVIIELQTDASGNVANIVYTASTRQEADQIYHSKLAFAAVSNVYLHAVAMLSNDGSAIKYENYYHIPEPEPTPEPENPEE